MVDAFGGSLTGGKRLLYLPPSSFSSRFSNDELNAYTCQITGWNVKELEETGVWSFCHVTRRVIVYTIVVKFGRNTITINRRYSDFDRMREQLLLAKVSVGKAKFPPKTIINETSSVEFISARMKNLETFLDSVLSSRSGSTNNHILEFLGINL